MRRLLPKLALLLAAAAGLHLVLAPLVWKYQPLHDPRGWILRPAPPRDFRVALLGDSVFTSSAVDAEAQTLWKQIESRTGRRVFPGALDGAKPLDILQAGFYLSRVLPRGSLVFIDVLPLRDWTDRTRDCKAPLDRLTGDYDPGEGGGLLPRLEHGLRLRLAPYSFTAMDLRNLRRYREAARDPRRMAALQREFWNTPPGVNRTWNRDGDFARVRFERFLAGGRWRARPDRFENLEILADTLSRRGITPVFVLTPWCEDLVHAYGGAQDREVLAAFERYRGRVAQYLADHGRACLDLHGQVPPDGFADCFHTNALGDGVMARALAEYLHGTGS